MVTPTNGTATFVSRDGKRVYNVNMYIADVAETAVNAIAC